MRLLLIHQAFVAPGEPGGTRHFELARALQRAGHEIVVIASSSSYLTGRRAVNERGWIVDQRIEGVRVRRVVTPQTLHRGFAGRLTAFLAFMVCSVVGALGAGRPAVVMGTSPPLFQALSAWFVALVRWKPFLFEVRDLWPAFAVEMGVLRNPILIRLAEGLERFLYRRASHIIINSPGFRSHLETSGVPSDKITLIANGVDPDPFDPADRGEVLRAAMGLEGFVVTYAGALGPANDIRTLLRAADRLRTDSDVRFLLVGDGKDRPALEAEAAALGLSNVTFLGSRPKSEMPAILGASNACVALLRDIPMFRTTYPNKVFDYMAAGRPTILAIDGVIREVIEASSGGVFVPPGDDEALADAVRALKSDPIRAGAMGASARRYVVEHFNRDVQAQALVAVVRRLAASGSA